MIDQKSKLPKSSRFQNLWVWEHSTVSVSRRVMGDLREMAGLLLSSYPVITPSLHIRCLGVDAFHLMHKEEPGAFTSEIKPRKLSIDTANVHQSRNQGYEHQY